MAKKIRQLAGHGLDEEERRVKDGFLDETG